MKTNFLHFVAAVFFVIAPLAADAQFFKKKPKLAPEKPRASCVWKISDKNSTIYLAGSVHMLREKDYPIPPAYRAAYEDCTRLVFEIDMKTMEDPKLAEKIFATGMFPPGETLESHLSKKTWKLLQKYIRSRGIGLFKLETMKPGFAFLTINSIESMNLGAKAELGLEKTFFALSQKDAKPSSGLETMEFQLTLFDQLSTEEKDELIRDTLQSVDKMSESIDKMLGAWKVGDSEQLDQLMGQEMVEGSKIRELMLINRNKNWIPHIEKILAGKENVYFLVGAGHLVGKESVVDLLRNKGYTVEQLSYDSVQPLAKKAKAVR